MDEPYFLPLADPQASLLLAGGKGASLARLAAAGLPIPAGFHITTYAYAKFITTNQLQTQIQTALSIVPTQLPPLKRAAGKFFDRTAAMIRSMIGSA